MYYKSDFFQTLISEFNTAAHKTHTTMTVYRALFFALISSILLSHHISSAGPARSIALAASRAIKIPRSIRAPFRNSEMMTARGFGKRALYPSLYDNTNYKESKFDGNKEYFSYSPYNGLDMHTPIHTLDTREARLKFHLDDGNLRIGRGFGKRSGDKECKFTSHRQARHPIHF